MASISRPNSVARTGSAPLSRLSPFSDLSDLRRGMDDLFGRWFGEPLTPFPTGVMANYQPAVDLWETPEAYVMHLTLPGVSKEDLELEVTGDTISIKGERKPANQESNVIYHVQNIGYGRFQVAYTLPAHIDAGGVTADYKDGILEVSMPKVETAKTRSIKVNIDQAK